MEYGQVAQTTARIKKRWPFAWPASWIELKILS
ncbi:hypothetical protein DSM3645_09802 [Blastopirellula marina DSM 3645]|uniref:Uncharacterized protein n=1 Tax=Blastopirellula marina DSM 3645 TaxID=314230 RepID=A3ZLQ1_9BACT|nr:hypothetical protein DSM3645_09802 [Blastopirellula marina DSM 3645]